MDERALRELLNQMTPEEKILQLVQVTGRSFGGSGELQTGPAAVYGGCYQRLSDDIPRSPGAGVQL